MTSSEDQKNEERSGIPAAVGRTGTGYVESIRSVLTLLDDADLLERSKKADEVGGKGSKRSLTAAT